MTLEKTRTTEVWDPDVKPDANDSSHVFRGEHTLLVKQVNCFSYYSFFFFFFKHVIKRIFFFQAVLGPEVPDGEVNVIEVEAMGYKSDIKFPVVVLKGGTGHSQCVLDLLFPDPPVTFKLVKGNGPIHLLGNHSVGSKYLNVVFNCNWLFGNDEYFLGNLRLNYILMNLIFFSELNF